MAKGSIEKRGENTWRLTIDLGINADGVRDRPRKTITIEDKALLKTTKRLRDYLETELGRFKIEVETGEYITAEKMALKRFIEDEYTPKYLSKQSPTTIAVYTGHFKNHIVKKLGHMQMDQIKTMHLVNFLDTYSDKSVSMQMYLYRMLKSTFKQGIKWGFILKNPMLGVDRPKGDTRSKRYYDSEQAPTVIEALNNEPLQWRLFFLLCMFGGLRRGEALGLQWHHVNFDVGYLVIEDNIVVGQHIKRPKSESSIRTVYMPDWFFEMLKVYQTVWIDHKKEFEDRWNKERDFIFHGGMGKPYYVTVASQRWRQFTSANNLPHIRLHDLRHTAATLLLESGVDLKVIQERHGHANYNTTANIYAHVTKKLTQDAVSKLEKFRPQSVPSTPHL
jgi:integrase